MMNILVVSEIRIYRDGLCEVLARSCQNNVSGSTASLMETLDYLAQSHVDVVLLDMATAEAMSLTQTVSAEFPQVKIIAFGLTEDKNGIIEYAEAGISGYVSKDSSVDNLNSTILHVYQGEFECSAKVTGALLERLSTLSRNKKPHDDLISLTPREMQVAQLISKGFTNGEIASHLNIRLTTAKTHVHHILDKLGVHRRGQVVMHLHKNLQYESVDYTMRD